jgi:butyryl-CoA dehydrogenase
MSDTLTDIRNIRFLLYEVLDIEKLTTHSYFEDHSKETFEMALDTAYQMAREVIWPALRSMDNVGAQFDGTSVKLPPEMHEIWKQASEGGWCAAPMDYEYGGQQFPFSVAGAAYFIFYCANSSAFMYVGGAGGAAALITSFGNQKLKDLYAKKLYSGQWAGTMSLTEPQAGSSLSDVTMTAKKVPGEDYYLIKGVKRFISSGDHDLTENIIHPTLVRLEGAVPGIKGISLMVVPKYRLDENGDPGAFNDVVTAGLEDKIGHKLSATVTLNYGDNDDCRGWLLGEENRGLMCMFQLMNDARIGTGIQSAAGASTAYQCALQYSKERLQGRALDNRDPTTPQVPIIRHPDLRRMLLEQKAFVEGALGLLFYGYSMRDQMRVAETEEERERYGLILDVITPVMKSHLSDTAFQSVAQAMQCFGGAGYTEEVPIAQLLRDSKVYSIYEGTNGIQALDLLGRKLVMKEGAAARALMMEVDRSLAEAEEIPSLKGLCEKLHALKDAVINTTMKLAMIGQGGDLDMFLCNASPFLTAYSHFLISWQWLIQAGVAQQALDAGDDDKAFYEAKIQTATYYIKWKVPEALSNLETIGSEERTALDFEEEWF